MAKQELAQQSAPRRQNRFLVMLLVGAALVSGAKDLDRLHDLTSGLVGFAASLPQRVNAAVKSPTEPSCPQTLVENDRSGQPFNWNGRVAPDQLAEMNDSNSGIEAASAVGGELELIVIKKVGCSKPARVPVQLVPLATELANGVWRPKESTSRRSPIEVVKSRSANQSAAIRVHHNDVQLNFAMRVPVRVEFVSRMISNEMKATAPGGNQRFIRFCPIGTYPDPHLMDSRMNMATGFARAQMQTRILGNARLANANRAVAIEFKTVAGTISLDLLQILSARLAAETLDDETVSESPRTFNGTLQRTMVVAPAAVEDAH